MKKIILSIFVIASIGLLAGCCTDDLSCSTTSNYVTTSSCSTCAKPKACNTCNTCMTCASNASYAYGGWY